LRTVREGWGTGLFLASLILLSFPPSFAQQPCGGLADCLEHLRSSDTATQTGAVFVLGTLKDRRAIPALLEIMEGDSKPEVRLSVIQALGSIGDPASVPAISKTLREDPKVQREAVKALVKIGGKPAIEALVEALNQEETRLAAVQGLGEIADPEAKPSLLALYRKTNDERIRGLAAIAIYRIRSVWGPTEAEMGLPIYPRSEFVPNARAEWIFATKDPVTQVSAFYRQHLKKPPMTFEVFKKKHESRLGESEDDLPTHKPEVIFVVEEQLFQGRPYPSKLIFLWTARKETEIQIFDALGEGD